MEEVPWPHGLKLKTLINLKFWKSDNSIAFFRHSAVNFWNTKLKFFTNRPSHKILCKGCKKILSGCFQENFPEKSDKFSLKSALCLKNAIQLESYFFIKRNHTFSCSKISIKLKNLYKDIKFSDYFNLLKKTIR